MRVLLRIVILMGGAWLASVPPAAPFDDDSTDDSRNLVQIRQVCANGRVVIDSEDHRASCRGDVAYRDPRQIGLFKNERRLTDQPVLDFKIARDGTVYYRTVTGPFLYDENGRLESHASPVRLYLVSSSGDVVYLNDRDDIFQNEKELNRGPAGIRIREIETFFQGRKIFLILNPTVSTTGSAIYLNEAGHLFRDGERLNPITSTVQAHKINTAGDVYFLDTQHRLYRNKEQLFDGRSRILEFQISNTGQVAYLTSTRSNNLYLEDQLMSAGAARVVEFHFTSDGGIVYQDNLGRTWKNGRLITR